MNTFKNEKALFFICLTIMFGNALVFTAEADARSTKGSKIRTHVYTYGRIRGSKDLLVEVQDPGCPACLRTLQKYLLKMKGVYIVTLPRWRRTLIASTGGKARPPQIIAINFNPKQLSKARLIERIKAHDLVIISAREVQYFGIKVKMIP